MQTAGLYIEHPFDYADIARFRPEAGYLYEKHVPYVHVAPIVPRPEHENAVWARAGSIHSLYRCVRGVPARDVLVTIACERVPFARFLSTSPFPSLTRVVLDGEGAARCLEALFADASCVLYVDDALRASLPDLEGLPRVKAAMPELLGVEASHAALAVRSLETSPRAYVASVGEATLRVAELTCLRALRQGKLRSEDIWGAFATFAFVATRLASAHGDVPGYAVYSTRADVAERIERAARTARIGLTRLDLAGTRVACTAFTPYDAIPAPADGARIDLDGYAIAALPEHRPALELVIDDTAVTDLAPLASWKSLESVSMRGLRVRSLAPIDHVRRLTVSGVEQLLGLSSLMSLRELTIERATLPDLRFLSGLALERLTLDHCEVGSLAGVEALPRLRHLTVDIHGGTVLDALAHAPSLRELAFATCAPLDLSRVPILPTLTHLSVRGGSIEHTHRLAEFASLTSLDLNTFYDGDARFLARLAALRALVLPFEREYGPIDVPAVHDPAALERLVLRGGPLTDVKPLARFTALVDLELGSDIVADAATLSKMPRLERLACNRDAWPSLEVLAALTRLETLSLDRLVPAPTTLDGIEQLRALRSFHANDVITLDSIERHPSLRSLSLRKCLVEDASSLASLPDLETLDLAYTPVRSLGPLAACRALTTLTLSEHTVETLAPLGSLPVLRALELDAATLTDAETLAAASQVESLVLRHARLDHLRGLAALTRLRTLDLRGVAGVTDFTPLDALPPLAHLYISEASRYRDHAEKHGVHMEWS